MILFLMVLFAPLLAEQFADLDPRTQKEFEAIAGVKPTSPSISFRNQLIAYRETQKEAGDVAAYMLAGKLIEELDQKWTQSELHAWFAKSMAGEGRSIFFQYPDLEEKTLADLCQMLQINWEMRPTLIDTKHRELMQLLAHVQPGSADEAIAFELRDLFEEQGSYGDFEQIQAKVRELVFASQPGYQGPREETLEIAARIADIEGTYALKSVATAIQEWQGRLDVNPLGELHALSKHLQEELEVLILTGGTLDDFHKWGYQTFVQNTTVYFQYPNLSVDELRTLFTAASLPIIDEPTPMDQTFRSVHRQLHLALPGSPNALYLARVYEYITELGSYAQLAQLDTWYEMTFVTSKQSPYMQYPGLQEQAIEKLAETMQLSSVQRPTLLDKKYLETLRWMQTLETNSAAYQLAEGFKQQIESIGSYGDVDQLQEWASSVVDNEVALFQSEEPEQEMPTVNPDEVPIEVAEPSEPVCKVGPNSRLTASFRGGDGVGYDKSYSTLAAFLSPSWARGFQPFLDLRGHIFVNGRWATNLGLGSRWQLGDTRYALGANFFYDWRNTFENLNPHQLGFGSELLGPHFDMRLNGYLPIGNTSDQIMNAFDHFEGNFLISRGEAVAALANIQGEVGTYLPWWFNYFDMYLAVGSYYLFKRDVVNTSVGDAWGVQGRLSAQIFDGLTAAFNITYDRIFHARPQGYIAYSLPLGPSNMRPRGSRWKRRYPSQECDESALMQRRMTQPVMRNEIVPIQTTDTRFIARDPNTGEPLFFIFVDNTSNSLGTFESPYPSMALAEANSGPGDIIYVFPGDGTSTNYDTGFVMKDRQVLQSATDTFSLFNVSVPPLISGSNPILTNTAGDALTLGNGVQVAGFTFSDATNDGVNGSSATDYLFYDNIITNNAVNGFESTLAPPGLKQVINNQFLGDNTSLTPDTAEILLEVASGNRFEIFNNTINSGNQAAYGIRAVDVLENSLLFISGNNISGYSGPGFFTAGACVIDANPTGSQPAEIFLTKNSLTGPTFGSYALNFNSGEVRCKINDNGFTAHTFFHVVVFNNAAARTILETNRNSYINPAISFGQVTIQQFGSTGNLCHQATGNNSLPFTGYLFLNSSGVPAQYQVESPDGTSAGVSTVNTGTVSFSPSPLSFTFVVPGTPCP